MTSQDFTPAVSCQARTLDMAARLQQKTVSIRFGNETVVCDEDSAQGRALVQGIRELYLEGEADAVDAMIDSGIILVSLDVILDAAFSAVTA